MAIAVLYLGATGYIGGSVLVSLIRENPDVNFNALVRSEADIVAVAATGAVATKGSLKDYEALSDLVAQADITINNADCDDLALTDSILKGMKKKFQQGKAVGTLIHTSGTGNFADGGKEGRFNPNSRVWTDAEDEIKQITPDLLHGKVDVAILKAGVEGYVNTFIVAPSTVLGRGSGPVKKIGPFLVGDYVQRGYTFYVGEGSNLFSSIHIEDLAEVYKLVFKQALETKGIPLLGSPYSRYFFVESDALPWKRVANTYAKVLFEKGKVSKPEAVRLTFDEAGPFAFVWSSSMYVKSIQTKTLGWQPKFEITDDVIVGGVDDGLAVL